MRPGAEPGGRSTVLEMAQRPRSMIHTRARSASTMAANWPAPAICTVPPEICSACCCCPGLLLTKRGGPLPEVGAGSGPQVLKDPTTARTAARRTIATPPRLKRHLRPLRVPSAMPPCLTARYTAVVTGPFISNEQVARARELARDITDPIFAMIDRHTTVSVERTVLRWFGVDGTGAMGAPLVNLMVDRLHAAQVLNKGAAYWYGRALRMGAKSPLE